MSHEVRYAFMSPGQGTRFDPVWLEDPVAANVVLVIQGLLPHGPDIKDLFSKVSKEEHPSSLDTHILLATVMSIAAERLKPYLKNTPYTVTGHSAGLPNSLGMTNFYTEGVKDLAETLITRGDLLDQSGRKSPGKMYAVTWSGKNGYEKLARWVVTQNELLAAKGGWGIWIACLNYENVEETQVVFSLRQGMEDLLKDLKEKFSTEIKKEPTELRIGVAAHSPLVSAAARGFEAYLNEQLQKGRVGHLRNGVVYVSDHISPDEHHDVMIDDKAGQIIKNLAQFDLPIQFQHTMEILLHELKPGKIVEIGGSTLSLFLKKLDRNINVISIKSPRDLDSLETELANSSGDLSK